MPRVVDLNFSDGRAKFRWSPDILRSRLFVRVRLRRTGVPAFGGNDPAPHDPPRVHCEQLEEVAARALGGGPDITKTNVQIRWVLVLGHDTNTLWINKFYWNSSITKETRAPGSTLF